MKSQAYVWLKYFQHQEICQLNFSVLLDDEYLSCVIGVHKYTLYNVTWITGVFEELSSVLDILQTKSFAESSDIAFLKQFVSNPVTTKLCEVSVPICYMCVSKCYFGTYY